MEVDEVPDEGDAVPFPGEDTVMMIYDGRPSPGVRRMSNLSPGTQLTAAGGAGTQGCGDTLFPLSLYISICRNMAMYTMATPKAKEKMTDGIA
jgi:hypothetical protein